LSCFAAAFKNNFNGKFIDLARVWAGSGMGLLLLLLLLLLLFLIPERR